MPSNKNSWSREMKDPDFHKKYELNTNPTNGRTYVPKQQLIMKELIINGVKVQMNENGVFVHTANGLLRIDVFPEGINTIAGDNGTILNVTTTNITIFATIKVIKSRYVK